MSNLLEKEKIEYENSNLGRIYALLLNTGINAMQARFNVDEEDNTMEHYHICDVKVIGGSMKTSNAVDATRDGFNAGMAV